MIRLLPLWVLLSACASAPPPEPPVVRPVRTMIVTSTGGEDEHGFSGIAQAGDQARIGFTVGGRVQAMHVKVGDTVTVGDLLAELDDSDYRLQLRSASAALSQANAAARNARAAFERVQALFVADNVSAADVDAARAGADASAAQASAARQQRALAASQLEQTRIVATHDGAVANVMAQVDEAVGAGQPVIVVAGGDKLEVILGVAARLISRVSRGQAATVRFPAVDATVAATVTEVGVASAGGSTYPVVVTLDESSDAFRSGMAAEITMVFAAAEEGPRIQILPAAVGEDPDGRFVWLVRPTEESLATVARRGVEIGPLNAGGLHILHGLVDGDVVVTAGVSRIRDGQQVRLLEASP